MKIIDAHIHYRPQEAYFKQLATAAGHETDEVHVQECHNRLNIAHAVVMGNRGLSLNAHAYPAFTSYCIGIEQESLCEKTHQASIDLVEQHLCRPECVGIKIYAGYSRMELTAPAYLPFYSLAGAYRKPVAIHTGATASSMALLKYSHPLLLDELAVMYPHVQFVMCHMGNPWLADAAAVLEKNENVAADLSGLLVGRVNLPSFLDTQAGYVQQLKTWIAYVENYDKFLFGTDWPLVNMEDYIGFVAAIIPERYHEQVFFHNANHIYQLKL